MRLPLLLVLLLAARLQAAPLFEVAPVSSLQKLTATAPGQLEPFVSQPAKLRAARGEWESFQIVVSAGAMGLDDVRLETDIAPLQAQTFRENFVYVAHPSGNRRREKLWWPDALIPVSSQDKTSIGAGKSAVFWITLQIPKNAAPGKYRGDVRVRAANVERKTAVELNVENFIVPPPSMRANVAVYYDILRDWYAKNIATLDDAQFARMKQRYYDFLLDYRINAYDLPVDWDSDEAAKYLRDDRVLSVRLPPLKDATFPNALTALRKNDALKKSYYYWLDEPTPERFEEVRETTKQLREIDPRLRHCVTAHPNAGLDGFVDIWCPNIGDFFGLGYLDFGKLKAERAKGNETWWYTMIEPKFPYPTWLLDDDAVSMRSYGWLMARHYITGFVYSMAHGWGPTPYENLQSFGDTNGDGTLLYPGEAATPARVGPLPSIRLMLLRDAIEDYELMRLLPDARREKLTRDVVGDGLLRQPNDETLWQSGKPRDWLFAALRGQNIPHKSTASPGNTPTFRLPQINKIKLDGDIDEAEWRGTFHVSGLRRASGEIVSGSEVWVAHNDKDLLVAFRGKIGAESRGEWSAIDIAPLNADERWRFVLTAKANAVIEKHTREGHFRILEGVDWDYELHLNDDNYVVEMRVPLSIIGEPQWFRWNAIQRVYDAEHNSLFIARAFPDAGDTQRMPHAWLCD